MLIKLSPTRLDKSLKIKKQGDTLIINDEPYDFSSIPDGGLLPQTAIESDVIISDVKRINDEITLTIQLPFGPNASEAQRFPEPIYATEDGEVILPC